MYDDEILRRMTKDSIGNKLLQDLEIQALEKLNDLDVYIPEPEKGISQKAQWASKPHKRKRK